jgi:hypothetical protein
MCARSPSGLRTFLELRYSEPGYAAASLHAGKHNRPNFRESPKGEVRRIPLLRTRVNKGENRRRRSGAYRRPRSSATIGALECCWFSSGSLVVYLEEPHLLL